MADNKGITKVKMANQEVKEYAMADAGQASSGIQAVVPLSDGKVAFTDQTRRQVMYLDRNDTVTVIAGTREEVRPFPPFFLSNYFPMALPQIPPASYLIKK